ncbi:MAG: SLBB domain-containing protein [Paramuribaculum sp.]|nr:SLBB domain-containing protein [Paramuribaculum sp.]
MTDQQVIDYIKRQSAVGKSEQQIGKELLAKGVTQEQVERLREKYASQEEAVTSKNKNSKTGGVGEKLEGTRESRLRKATEPDEKTIGKMETVFDIITPDSLKIELEDTITRKKIFGHDVFTNKALSFEPNENMATPADYRLGPGDEVVIDIWGASEDQIRDFISPEGSIIVSQIGPVYLNGLTIAEANSRLKQLFASKYAGVAEEDTEVSVNLGDVRSILVNVMGEVNIPGSYRLSPFSTVFNALYRAGGINEVGTLRNIEIVRNGNRLVNVDIYDYLFGGKKTGDVRLQEGDVIIVPPYAELINVEGTVKRPMYYELREGESLAKLLEYTGGFAGNAYTDMITVSRQTGKDNEIFNVSASDFSSYRLKDGDIVTVGSVTDRFLNKVELKGSVMRPGNYALGNGISTLRDVLRVAEGLADDAFSNRAILYREGTDNSLEAIGVDLADILAGRAPDVKLRPNDMLVVSSVKEIMDQGEVTINGQITNPGDYPYAKGITIEDLIVIAGGLQQGASTARVDVSRRVIDPASLKPTENVAEVFTFALKDGLMLKGDPGFELKPYDIVEVRKSPGYQTQKLIEVEGEVLFEGEYALQKRNERISEIIRRAGGIIDGAYLRGARLMRKMTEDEKAARDESIRLATQSAEDSISIDQLALSDVYSVGIELEKALAQPGSAYDLVLKDGDKLIIPEEMSTVKISGDVMFPNVVGYQPGKKLGYYIDQAGGYGERAKKSKAFVVYMNGMVARAKRNTPIEPGCQIIVPSKPKSGGTNWAQVIGYVSSFASLGTMAATIYSIFKK